jgi:hypothetical protein
MQSDSGNFTMKNFSSFIFLSKLSHEALIFYVWLILEWCYKGYSKTYSNYIGLTSDGACYGWVHLGSCWINVVKNKWINPVNKETLPKKEKKNLGFLAFWLLNAWHLHQVNWKACYYWENNLGDSKNLGEALANKHCKYCAVCYLKIKEKTFLDLKCVYTCRL